MGPPHQVRELRSRAPRLWHAASDLKLRRSAKFQVKVMALHSDAVRVLDFWFPDGVDSSIEVHKEYWGWRMRGGAHETIIAEHSQVTEAAANGEHDDWAATSLGRMALLIVLDQFSRSLWSGSARAFAQDEHALRVCMEGLENGHYQELPTVWHKTFFTLPLGHCEGSDHLERLDRAAALGDAILESAPAHLRPIYAFSAQQPREVRKVIEAFGRHPHRNDVLGRESTPEELEYIERGAFPHNRADREGLD